MRLLGTAFVAALVFGQTAAQAAIRINESRYEGDALIVRGQTTPNQEVTLDGKHKTKADVSGHFEFIVKQYKSPYCMSDITTADDSYSAVIAGCLLRDAASSGRSAGGAVAAPETMKTNEPASK